MKNMKKGMIMMLALFATVSISAQQVNHSKKIKKGIVTGELTANETLTLKKQLNELKRVKRNARRDGVITRSEQLRINKLEAQLNRNIYHQKNDRQIQGRRY